MKPDAKFSGAVAAFRRGDLSQALEIAESAIATSPTPQWRHLLGLLRCRLGDPAGGVALLRAAVEAEPANVENKVMLARALIDSGMPHEVLEMQKPRSTTMPELAFWHARAEAASATDNGDAAVEAWTIIASLTVTDSRAWINLGRSLLAQDKFDDAANAYRRALAISPRDVAALSELGLTYDRTNRLDQLAALLDDALTNGIGKDQLNYLWAVREMREGRFRSAGELLLKSGPAQDPVRWYRLRARIADKEGEVRAAFEASVAMNRASDDFEQWRERASAFRRELRELAATLTAEWATSLPKPAPGDRPPPAFLVGFPRSGTTLLDTFLMGHPSTVVLEEHEILLRAGRNMGPIAQLPLCRSAAIEAARRAYLSELDQHVGPGFGGVVIDKQPLNMLVAPYIHLLFPGAPIIFVQRHPCDAVLSGFMQSFVPNLGMASFLDLGDSADFYDAAMSVWSAATRTLPLNVLTVPYEQLIGDPEGQLRGIVDFLGLDWDDRVLDHRATAKARGMITSTSYDQVTEKLTTTAIGRWQRYKSRLEPIFPILLPWAERLGYGEAVGPRTG